MAQKGTKVVTPGLIGQVLPACESKEMRVGFTVTKKVGNAVTRNRTRRRLREASRLIVKETGAFPGEVVLIGRNQTAGRSFEALKGDVRKVFKTMKPGGVSGR